MEKLTYSTTISIDTRTSTFHYYSMVGDDISSIEHRVKSYAGLAFDDAFYDAFKRAIAEFFADIPSETVRKITLVLPDEVVATDAVNVPTMRMRHMTRNNLSLALGELYKNYPDLSVQFYQAAQNRQYTTFTTAAVQTKILAALHSACAENRLLIETMTFASAAAAGALVAMNPKGKGTPYLLLDIKDTYSRFTFVNGGRAIGYYYLPFGAEFLSQPKYVQEDMLFDHTMAELTVLNAREKAKAKKLSVLSADTRAADGRPVYAEADEDRGLVAAAPAPHEEYDAMEEHEELHLEPSLVPPMTMREGSPAPTLKVMAKKQPRRLPKFMLRETPNTPDWIASENFRVFMKWALTLIESNDKLTRLGAPEYVCVNMPEALGFLVDYANSEREENGIEFRRLESGALSADVLANLELFGGFFPRHIHGAGQF